MSNYYIGTTSQGAIVSRTSTRSDFTYAIANSATGGWSTFSTSEATAWANLPNGVDRAPLEAVPVALVDRQAFLIATGKKQAPVVLSAPSVPTGPAPATREAWMGAFVAASRTIFHEVGATLPEVVRVSVGFPSKGSRSKVIGECWSAESTQDGVCEIFIRPSLQSDSARVAGVLTHELIHAALGHEEGHGKVFGRVARALGLEGKLTATTEGDQWRSWAQPILDALGPLPGASLGELVLSSGKKTQTTRYLKVTCDCCGWQARVTAKHLEGRTLSCPDTECDGTLSQAGGSED